MIMFFSSTIATANYEKLAYDFNFKDLDGSPLKLASNQLLEMVPGKKRNKAEKSLTEQMVRGSIDANIMVKLDRENRDRKENVLPPEYSDSKAALRGYANSIVESNIIFSAGINQSLYSYISEFKD